VNVGGEGGNRFTGGFERSLLAPLLSPFVGRKVRGLIASTKSHDLQVLARHIDAGTVTPVIDRTYPLSQAPDAIRPSRRAARGARSSLPSRTRDRMPPIRPGPEFAAAATIGHSADAVCPAGPLG